MAQSVKEVDSKYLPSLAERKYTVVTQIEETKKIIFRNQIEAEQAKENGNKALVAEANYNNGILTDKIDTLEKFLENLNEEPEKEA